MLEARNWVGVGLQEGSWQRVGEPAGALASDAGLLIRAFPL